MDSSKTNRPGVALVTGAAGIIGPFICAALRKHGWTVVGTDRDEECLRVHEKLYGQPIDADRVIIADLTGQATCAKLVAETESTHGPIRLLVNNAAASEAAPVGTFTEAMLDLHWRVNVTVPLFLMQAALGGLRQTRGSVINVSSVHAEQYVCGHLPYSVSKAALEAASTAMAMELAPDGIRVNSLRLGSVPGPAFLRDFIHELSPEQTRQFFAEVMEAHLEARKAWSASQEVCRPEEVGEVIAFLASDHAKSIIGTTITIDAGLGRMFRFPSAGQDWNPREEARRWIEARGWIPPGKMPA